MYFRLATIEYNIKHDLVSAKKYLESAINIKDLNKTDTCFEAYKLLVKILKELHEDR